MNKWDLQLSELCAIWQGGCIIRAKILNLVEAALTKDPALPNLLLDDAIAAEMARTSCRLAAVCAPCDGLTACRCPR